MRATKNNLEVKKLNRNRAFRYINSVEQTSMPEIAKKLGVSVPTVLTLVNELKEEGIVREAGELKSTGGRKAKAIVSVKDFRYAIGVDVTKNHVGLVYTNLSLEALEYRRVRKSFERSDAYVRDLAQMVTDFVKEEQIPPEKIVGIGISVPGIVDHEKEYITNSHALDIYQVDCKEFSQSMPYPCSLVNDADAAAIAESTRSVLDHNLVYLSLSNTVGGAIAGANIIDGAKEDNVLLKDYQLFHGDNWRSAEFGHMMIHPGGRKCYCGKRGCADPYCSALYLANHTDGNLERFFEELEKGNEEFRKYFSEYTDNLAIVIDSLRMCMDCEVVLGGYVGNHLQKYLPEIQEKAGKYNIFGGGGQYIRTCRAQHEASALGAAIRQIAQFMEMV